MIRALRLSGQAAMILGCLVVLVAVGAYGQGARRESVPGDVIMSITAGTARTEVDKLATGINATVIKTWGSLDYQRLTETYYLQIAGGPNVADSVTAAAIAKLKTDSRVRYAGPNKILQWHDSTPNDPKYAQQWHLPLMNMPKAWDIQKGSASVLIAILDSGCDVTHPDLAPRLLPPINASGTGNPTDVTDNIPHGTHVLGIAGAATDNGVGVSGVTWQNVKMQIIKLGDAPTTVGILNGLDAADTLKANVVNCSFGGADASDTPNLADPQNAKILAMAKKGVIFSISAGNSGPSSPPINPANMATQHPNIYCVASCGPTKKIAPYSSVRPYTTICAPGGDSTNAPTDAVLSTLPVTPTGGQPSSYGYEEGTSMAAPAFSGAVGILLSIPGVTPADVRDAVLSTANNLGLAVPNPQYGAGVVDVNAAAIKLAVSVFIATPDGTGGKANRSGAASQPDPVETLRPTILINVRNIFPVDLKVWLDDIPVTDFTITNVSKTKADANAVDQPYVYDVTWQRDTAPGTHVIRVEGTNQGPPVRTDTDIRTFQLIPHLVPQGRSLIAIPYFQDGVTPQYYLGTDFRLARWLPDQGRYVFYTSFGPQDPGASFNTDVVTHQDGDATSKQPVGLAFWSDTESVKPILTKGQALLDKSFVIPLRGNGTGSSNFISWNMIGDPFPFDVPFNALLVDTPEGRLSIQIAAEKGYILPNIYSYDGLNGYTFRTLPDGALKSWTGHWVGVISRLDIALVVPPLKSSRAAAIPTRAAVAGSGWTLRLQASSKNLRDTFNFIGMNSRASDGYDLSDVAKPPMMSPYLTLGIDHSTDWSGRSGLYAQDIRSNGGAKTWNVVVGTDQPDASVLLTWDSGKSLPRDVKLTIKDESTGQVTDMRTRNSISFTNGTNQSSRRFTITAVPRLAGAVRISNVAVRQSGSSRAAGTSVIGFTLTGDATYDVRIMSATGQNITTVGSRAVAAGDVNVVWNGKDSANRAVPAGTYIVLIRATGPDGESVKVIQPFAMLR